MRSTLVLLVLALALTSLAAAEVVTQDENGDGKPDRWFTLAPGGAVVEYRADTDYDGRVDAVVRYSPDERIEYEAYDYNLDGTMDDFYYYEKGILARREVDSNFDGKVDLWVTLVEGRYVKRMERDTDFDGKVDKVKDYGRTP